MRLMQDEQPIEHHLTWRDSAFHSHNHGTMDKRKMLGGVSFDGGAALENNKSRSSTTQAGVQEAQPPLTDKYNENLSLSEMGLGLGRTKGKADTASSKEGDGKSVKNATAVKNTTAAKNSAADIKDEAVINLKSGRSSLIRGLTLKLGKGIRTLLERSGQDSKKQNEQKPKKKLSSGTRR